MSRRLVFNRGEIVRLTRRTIREILRDQRGAAIVLVMGAMIAVVSVTALAVDVGKLLTARGEAQRAADAGALAAASAFIDDPGNAEVVAKARAKQFAELHSVRHQNVLIVTDEDVQVDLVNLRVDVTVRHIGTRANPIPTIFARVFGVDVVDVQAHAAAEAYPAGDLGCLLPLALPDMWQDDDGDEKWDWDDADKDKALDDGEYEPYRACSFGATAADIVPSDCTGWGGPWRNEDGLGYDNGPKYEYDVGRPVTLKPGNPQRAMQPGWFFPWRPEGDTGGADYRENITNCIDPALFDEDGSVEVDIEPGNMIGPTIQGFEMLVGGDSHRWADGCTLGLSSCVTGGALDDDDYSERIVHVPLFDPTTVLESGMQAITFTGFASMFIDDISSNDIKARWLRIGGSAGSDGEQASQEGLPLAIRLIE